MNRKYISAADTAKIIRKALKESFPGVKFSVRTDTYSGGASIGVNWTDGPTAKMVDAVVKRFAGSTFDGMTDCKDYHNSVMDGEVVHFGADFIFTNRKHSRELLERVKAAAVRRYGNQFATLEIKDGYDSAYFDRDYKLNEHWLREILTNFSTYLNPRISATAAKVAYQTSATVH